MMAEKLMLEEENACTLKKNTNIIKKLIKNLVDIENLIREQIKIKI